ncbi:MAG: hypothetical protein CVU00_15010 [Bacteroidetes bacterium HGW-Bacteroidetes-17]|jgi:NhaP-type Na+/H+ or K+/H+ antiporter|nr:MAG: hypothetical protein CVU00_15010 [Bacteroidetes bacterium HGW-Bacteroidetes-17]
MNVEGVSRLSFTVGGNILMTLSISAILSYVLLYIIQNIKGDAKFFLFLAVLILLYSIGKMFHLSSLIIILLFGLLLRNHKVLLFKKLEDWLYDDKIDEVYREFRLITVETSFLVRTFFFVVFGMTLPLATLISWRVWIISVTFLAVAYMLRFLLFAIVERKDIFPQVFIAPRGLISILLFFAIPESLKNAGIESGVLFMVIIATSIIMAMSLITNSRKKIIIKGKS